MIPTGGEPWGETALAPATLFTPALSRGNPAIFPVPTMLPIATVVALLLAVYLVVAMLAPEWFA